MSYSGWLILRLGLASSIAKLSRYSASPYSFKMRPFLSPLKVLFVRHYQPLSIFVDTRLTVKHDS